MEDATFAVSVVKFSAIWGGAQGGAPAAKRTQNCRENPLPAAKIFHA